MVDNIHAFCLFGDKIFEYKFNRCWGTNECYKNIYDKFCGDANIESNKEILVILVSPILITIFPYNGIGFGFKDLIFSDKNYIGSDIFYTTVKLLPTEKIPENISNVLIYNYSSKNKKTIINLPSHIQTFYYFGSYHDIVDFLNNIPVGIKKIYLIDISNDKINLPKLKLPFGCELFHFKSIKEMIASDPYSE